MINYQEKKENTPVYIINCLYENGTIALLSVKGKSQWRTKKMVEKHCQIMVDLLDRGHGITGIVDYWIELIYV